jgi:uncharacterized protein (TIGR03437 family)
MNRPMCALLAVLAAGTAGAAGAPGLYRIETVAGSSLNGDGGPALLAQIGSVQGVAVDRWGNCYLSDTDNHRVRKVDASGVITTVAGSGTAGFSGDGGPATAAQLNLPYGLAADAAGYLYIADLGNSRVRRVAPDGTISTYAGGGNPSGAGEGGLAVDAALRTPRNLALDAAGNLYVSEFEGHRVRKITPDGRIATVAGTGVAGFGGDGGPAASAQLAYPAGLALDRAGSLYVADSQNQRVRKVAPDGAISTAAGGGTAPLITPVAAEVDASGTLFISDNGGIRSCGIAGTCTSLSGTQAAGDLAMDQAGNLYAADGTQVRKIDPRGQVQTVAGDAYLHAIGDGAPATVAQLFQPAAVSLDSTGNLYIADSGTERVRQVLPSGVIQTIAGTGIAAAGTGDLHAPMGVAVNAAGDLTIADTANHRIRKVSAGATVTIAGTGTAGAGPEGLAPGETPLNSPRGVCVDRAGTLFIVDTGNHRVLQIAPGGTVRTAAGNGSPGYAGDGGPARLAQLNQPSACTLDAAGNLFIADTANHCIRQVTASGAISTIAGAGQAGAGGDEGPATAAALNAPRGVAVDESGSVYIADTANHRIRQVTPDGVIHTIAGQDAAGFTGDGGPALQAQLHSPGGLALDGLGNLYVADTGNNRVRRLVGQSVGAVSTRTFYVVNAASLQAGPVSPGEIVTIFGAGIGSGSAAAAAFDSSGLLPTQLAGAEVRFDGVPAPLFYAQSGQINAQVPYSVGGGSTHLQVFDRGNPVNAADLAVAPAAPALFPSLNTQDNPASRGRVVVFYATGEGLTNGPNVSGSAALAPYPQPLLPVTLTVAGIAAQLLYAGSAPGTAGVLQVNAVIPGGFVQPGPAVVQLSVGSAASPPLTIWLQ